MGRYTSHKTLNLEERERARIARAIRGAEVPLPQLHRERFPHIPEKTLQAIAKEHGIRDVAMSPAYARRPRSQRKGPG